MIELLPILRSLQDRKILHGPSHFVLGDGFGNPGHHSEWFVDWQKFNDAVDLYAIMVERLASLIQHLHFDKIVAIDEESLPTARMLAKVFTHYSYRPEAPCEVHADAAARPAETQLVLIHDNFVNRGRQVQQALAARLQGRCKPVAITSLFSRIAEPHLFDLPIYAAVDHVMTAAPADACRMCRDGAVPIDLRYGKGVQYLEKIAAAAKANVG